MPKSIQDTLQDWENLLGAVQETECELGGVAPFREALMGARNQAIAFKALKDSLEASTEDVAQRLRMQVAAGDAAFVSLRGYIRSILGNRSGKLRRYGMKPFRQPAEEQAGGAVELGAGDLPRPFFGPGNRRSSNPPSSFVKSRERRSVACAEDSP